MKRFASAFLFVVALLPAQSAFAFGQNKIVYDKFKWNIYHSTHFDVYFYDEERPSLQKVVDMAESAYDDISRKFNFQISKKIPLIYYATHSAFEQTNVSLGFIPEGVGAFAEPVKNRMVLPIDLTDEKLLQLISHELTHIFEYEVLFQGKLGKTVTANPPLWFMEGLASFMGQDEDTKDRMVLRDAVVNDIVPSIKRAPNGYFAYRYGHAIFKFVQEKYGWDGLRDFIYEYRNTLGNNVEKALKRAFDLAPDEFDSRFRTWLRKQYLPALVAKGEPQEYGEPFKINPDIESHELSPIPSPSGDLLAGFTTYKEDVDIALFNIPERRLLRNLTVGYSNRYEYPIAQSFTVGPVMGRDIAFAPNGDQIAVFVKRERGRNLLLINPLNGEIEKSIEMKVEQQLSPTYSPDAKKVAFTAFSGNQPDIYLYDLGTGVLTNLTNDRFFDGAPVFSPDGKWLVYSSVVDGYAKLFRLNLANTSERYQVTSGQWNDIDAFFTPDGKRLFFASDKQTGRDIQQAADILQKAEDEARRTGGTPPADPTSFASYNIYSLNLENGDLLQYTDVVGGCFTPVVFTGTNNRERLVFASYYKMRWQLFSATTDKPLHEAEKTQLPSAPMEANARTAFQPPVEVAIDDEKIEKAGGFKLFVEDVQVNAGVSSDQLLVSRSVIFMSDMLGNRRFIAALDSVSSFSNFDFIYFDLRNRWNWGTRLFDNRSFYTSNGDLSGGGFSQRERLQYRETGALGFLSYPFSRYHRGDIGAGYIARSITYPTIRATPGPNPDDPPDLSLEFASISDNYPLVFTQFTGDSAIFKSFGPVSGRRYELFASFAPDTKASGTKSSDFTVDFRQYFQLTSRSSLAARIFTGYSTGNLPNFYYFGGLNTLRGYDFRSIFGTQAAFANFEIRFPLVDLLATPIVALQQIRGTLFFDIGAAAFEDQPFRFLRNGRLRSVNEAEVGGDGLAALGYGISFNLFGLELHWDFAKRFDLKDTESRSRTSFWIGDTF